MTQTKTNLEGPESVPFQSQCMGRYLIDLPKDMKLMRLYYVHPLYSFKTDGDGANGGRSNDGLLLGKERIDTWLDFVETERKDNFLDRPAKYLTKQIDKPIKTVILDLDVRGVRNDPNADRVFRTYLLVDNSNI